MTSRRRRRGLFAVFVLMLGLALFVLARNASGGSEPWVPPNELFQPAPVAVSQTPPDFRVAFLGDQGLSEDARSVLQLVRDEAAQLVVFLGDFDYQDSPSAWDAMVNGVLGPQFPALAVIGNHDIKEWRSYREKLIERLEKMPEARCTGDYGIHGACMYHDLLFVLSGAGTAGSGHATFIRDQLAQTDSTWRICAWHKNQNAMQLGAKQDEVGWEPYEACHAGGAIIATAHEHAYQRTKTLGSVSKQLTDASWPDGETLGVGSGSSFVFVTGLGGHSIRGQERCRASGSEPACRGEWAAVYTWDQGATFGALFIDFNAGGDPSRARGYFKNVRGETVDEFTVVSLNRPVR